MLSTGLPNQDDRLAKSSRGGRELIEIRQIFVFSPEPLFSKIIGTFKGSRVKMDIIQISLVITAAMGGVLILALLSRKENKKPNVILSLMLLLTMAFAGVLSLKINGKIANYPLLWRTPLILSVAFNTLLYFYILSLTVPGFKFHQIRIGYYLPLGFALAWYLFFQLLPKESIFWSDPDTILYERYFRGAFAFLIKTFFLFLCFFQIYKYRNYVNLFFSEVGKLRLNWLQNLLIIFTIPWLLRGIDLLTGPFWTIDKYAVPLISLLVLAIAFLGLRQSVIFSQEDEAQIQVLETSSAQVNHVDYAIKTVEAFGEKSSPFFTEAELEEWKEKLADYMVEAKPYLNPELRLGELAQALKVKPYKVSEILNRGFGESFYHFINRYRIQEAKARLQDPKMDHLNILAIANDSGFNTKSVFNEVFRKYTGQTPSQIRDRAAVSSEN